MGVTTRWACWRSWPAMKHLSNATRTSLASPTAARHCTNSWAHSVAEDDELLELLGALPPWKQQPNLLFAAVQ